MRIQINQIDLVLAINAEIDKQAKHQGIELMLEPRWFNATLEAATAIVAAYNKPITPATKNMGLANWLASDDTGVSSKTMASHLCGVIYSKSQWSHPLDNSDLGRCIRFLAAVPEARAEFPRMSEVSPIWSELVKDWDSLVSLYEKDHASKELYERMKAMGC